MDARQKAGHAERLLADPVLKEVMEDAHRELVENVIHGDTEEEREDARQRLLGLDEIKSRLRYLTTELEMAVEEEE